jgi:cysteine-rich repeat protein
VGLVSLGALGTLGALGALGAGCAAPPAQQTEPDGGDGTDATVSYCGDGVVAPSEGCDDGNLLDGDGCSPTCSPEPGWVCSGEPSACTSLCGNGVLDDGEQCDGANLDGQDCTTVPGGYSGGTLSCGADCRFDTIGCRLESCGNGTVEGAEACDDGNSSNNDACMNNCQQARCGDGYVWTGQEDCDDGNSANNDACLTDCTAASCGDGYVWAGQEDCDDGNSSNNDACLMDCTEASCGDGYVWAGQEDCDDGNSLDTDGCLAGCTLARCGDGVVWAGQEDCDDGNTVAGDGCSPSCAAEALPVLHWATGQPAVWDEQTLYYAGEPHAPTTAVVAAANVDQRDRAYLFTATTYHVLSLPGHQWLDSGPLQGRFPNVPGADVLTAFGVSWSTETESTVSFITSPAGVGPRSWSYTIDNATGAITADPDNPNTMDWSSHTDPPSVNDARATYIDLANANGWVSGDPSALCGATATSVGPNLGAFTVTGDIYLYEAGSCFEFYDHMPVAQFGPFDQPAAPAATSIVAAFFSTEHGDRLYVVSVP